MISYLFDCTSILLYIRVYPKYFVFVFVHRGFVTIPSGATVIFLLNILHFIEKPFSIDFIVKLFAIEFYTEIICS